MALIRDVWLSTSIGEPINLKVAKRPFGVSPLTNNSCCKPFRFHAPRVLESVSCCLVDSSFQWCCKSVVCRGRSSSPGNHEHRDLATVHSTQNSPFARYSKLTGFVECRLRQHITVGLAAKTKLRGRLTNCNAVKPLLKYVLNEYFIEVLRLRVITLPVRI